MVLCAASTGSKTCCPLAAMVREFEEVVGGETDADTARSKAAGRVLYCAHQPTGQASIDDGRCKRWGGDKGGSCGGGGGGGEFVRRRAVSTLR